MLSQFSRLRTPTEKPLCSSRASGSGDIALLCTPTSSWAMRHVETWTSRFLLTRAEVNNLRRRWNCTTGRSIERLAGRRVGVLGAGFRPDVREHICSPTLVTLVAKVLRRRGQGPWHPLSPMLNSSHGFTPWHPESLE